MVTPGKTRPRSNSILLLNLRGSVSFYTDGIWPGIGIENGHVLAIRNAVFSAFQLDSGGGVFAVLNKRPELEAADIADTSMA